MQEIGKILIIFGIAFLALGVFLILAPRVPWIGRLPGDIVIHKKT